MWGGGGGLDPDYTANDVGETKHVNFKVCIASTICRGVFNLNRASKSLTSRSFCVKLKFFPELVIFRNNTNMNIALKFEFHTVCICRHEFRTDFFCKINSKSNFRESVDFQKNGSTS